MAKLTKQIVFDQNLLNLAESRIEEMGINFPEYVRLLVINDTQAWKQNIPFLSQQTENDIFESFIDFQSGNYTSLHNANDINKHFDKLDKN